MQMNGRMKKEILSMTGTWTALTIMCVIFVSSEFRSLIMFLVTLATITYFYWKVKKGKKKDIKERPMQIVDLEPDYKKLCAEQIMLRVKERLYSKFPEAIVEISEKDIIRIISTGKCAYVPIRHAEHYSHMSIGFGSGGDIQLKLFSFVNFEEVHSDQMPVVQEENWEIDQWYSQRGQQLLTELITDMNSRGYTKLSINESGEVTVKENGRSVLKDRFKEIPPKEQWARLKELMAEDEVSIQVSGKRLTLTW